MISIVPGVPSAPESSQKRTSTFVGKGRKLMNAFSASVTEAVVSQSTRNNGPLPPPLPASSEARPTPRKHATISDLERMLEDDALKLMNMKKEMVSSKQEELDKSKKSLIEIRKEYDGLYITNELKTRELNEINNKIRQLREVANANIENGFTTDDTAKSLHFQTMEVLKQYESEQRTTLMQKLMINRLESEIGQCRKFASTTTMELEQIKHELNLTSSSVETGKHDLLEQEIQLDRLVSTVKARREERDSKMRMLSSLVLDSENSLAKVQANSPINTMSLGGSMISANGYDKTGGAFNYNLLNTVGTGPGSLSSPKSSNNNKLGGAGGIYQDSTEFDEFSSPNHEKQWTITQVKEMIERYKSKEARLLKLEHIDLDLKNSISQLSDMKVEITSNLDRTAYKYQQLASSRQLYQEVDMKDAALTAARKECEDCQEREHRLRLNIESIKRALPRFLSKLTKLPHPIPSADQLPDAILKLEDEISKLIKFISSAMMKDATPEDLAFLSQQNSSSSSGQGGTGAGGSTGTDSQSEVGKLQTLPGYSRLQRTLFYNLMSARPDISDKNIRINRPTSNSNNAYGSGSNNNNQDGSKYNSINKKAYDTNGNNQASSSTLGGKDDDFRLASQTGMRAISAPLMDRDTVKSVSQLVIDRDESKFLAMKVIDASKTAPSNEFAYVPLQKLGGK